MQALLLPQACAAELAALAQAAYPLEACALLVGVDAAVTRIVPAPNVAEQPARTFEIDPGTQIRLRRALRETGGPEYLLGLWHSHPDGRAEPSATDAAMIHEPALIWLISAVTTAGASAPAAFLPQADGKSFSPLALHID